MVAFVTKALRRGPGKARKKQKDWIPAYAGMTELGNCLHNKWNQIMRLLI